MVLVAVSLLGLPQFLLKQGSIISAKLSNKSYGNLIRKAFKEVFLIASSITLLLIIFSKQISEKIFDEPLLKWPLVIAALGMVPLAFNKLTVNLILSLRKVWQSNLFGEKGLSVFIVSGAFIIFLLLNVDITINTIVVIFVASHFLVVFSSGLYFKMISPDSLRVNVAEKETYSFKDTRHFYTINLITILMANIDFLLLGVLSDVSNVGLYTSAVQLAFVSGFILQVTNTAISPKLAVLYVNSQVKDMESMLRKVTLVLILIGVAFFSTYILFGKWILGLWGSEFKEAYLALLILGFGQFINIATGSSGQVLAMCGFEKVLFKLSIFSLIICIILHIILIPIYGFLGAAISNAIRLVLENSLKLFFSQKLAGINILPTFNSHGK